LCKEFFAIIMRRMRTPTPSDRTVVTDVESLRAIAHPLRARLLGALRTSGPATATELAARFSESSGATSYHLRQLARYGFIVEDEQQPSHRERRWRAAAMLTSWDDADFADDPAAAQASDAMHELVLRHLLRRDRQWRERRRAWGRAWLSSAGSTDVEVRLTPDATRRLHAEVLSLARQLEQESAGSPDGATVAVYLQAVPVHPEDQDR
jgi:DNA-binding transcriptional ArsR family regulator